MIRGLRAVTVGLLLVGLPACGSQSSSRAHAIDTPRGLPLRFEANRGQTDPRVHFLARGSGHTVFLTASEAVFVLTEPDSTGLVLRMTFVGANPGPRVIGLEPLPGKANYLVGNDPARWRTNVPLYAKVQYSRLYPGIDLGYSGDQSRLAFEVVVHPGADPRSITLGWQGADSVEATAQGALALHMPVGVISLPKPVISQQLDGVGARREIGGGYVRTAARQAGIRPAVYDASQPLVISGSVPLALPPHSFP